MLKVHRNFYPYSYRISVCGIDLGTDGIGKLPHRRTWRGITCINCLRSKGKRKSHYA